MWIYLHLTAIFATQLRILSRDDMGATTRLAWFMVLIGVPLIGVVLYFLFGEANIGKRANRKTDQINALIAESSQSSMSSSKPAADNLLLQDKATTEAICDRKKDYVLTSHLVTAEDIQSWSLPRRIWQNVIATLGPVL